MTPAAVPDHGEVGGASARAIGELLGARGARTRSEHARPLHLPSRPETVVCGVIPVDRDPVLTVAPGAVAVVDTVSHQGLVGQDPVAFFGSFGVSPADVLADVVDIAAVVRRPPAGGSHVLTGPIYVEGATPGDVLEVHVLEANLRVGYGINSAGRGSGVLPGLLDARSVRLLRTDADGQRIAFAPGVHVPIEPFPGIMAVAPPPEIGTVPSKPPARWGGNLDLKHLTAGSRLFLPVCAQGAQFYVGDPHSAQGDGEVNGTAVEHSCTFTLEFSLHKDTPLAWPLAETSDHYVPMGLDEDLDKALEIAVEQTIHFLTGLTGGRLSPADAYALCSVGVDFRIAEAVNHTKVVRADVPKSLFAAASLGPPR